MELYAQVDGGVKKQTWRYPKIRGIDFELFYARDDTQQSALISIEWQLFLISSIGERRVMRMFQQRIGKTVKYLHVLTHNH